MVSQDNRDSVEAANSLVEADDDKIELFAKHDPDIFRHIAKAYLDTFACQKTALQETRNKALDEAAKAVSEIIIALKEGE